MCVCFPTSHIRMLYVIQMDPAAVGLRVFCSSPDELQCSLKNTKEDTKDTRMSGFFCLSVFIHVGTQVNFNLHNQSVAMVLE